MTRKITKSNQSEQRSDRGAKRSDRGGAYSGAPAYTLMELGVLSQFSFGHRSVNTS